MASGIEGLDVFELEGNWYFNPEATKRDLLALTDVTYVCSYRGTSLWFDLVTEQGKVRQVAWVYKEATPDYAFMQDKIGFYPGETATTIAKISR